MKTDSKHLCYDPQMGIGQKCCFDRTIPSLRETMKLSDGQNIFIPY